MPASIFIYSSGAESYDTEIGLAGNIGPLFVDCGVTYVFYEDTTATGYKLGYIYGNSVKDLCEFTGSMPKYSQVTKYRNFIIWVSGGKVWAFGSSANGISSMVFQLADAGYDYAGALAAPFGTPIVASWDGSSAYQLSKFYGYDTVAYWYSKMFAVGKGTLKNFTVYCDTIASGGRADIRIVTDNGRNSYTGFILDDTTINARTFPIGAKVFNNFRLEISFYNGSTTYPVKINRVEFNFEKDDD